MNGNRNEMKLWKFFQGIPPAELARLRGRRQDTSTRDKKKFLSLLEEIQTIAEAKGVEVMVVGKIEQKKIKNSPKILDLLTYSMEARYLLQSSQDGSGWVLTDQLHQIVIIWEDKKFNETQKVTLLQNLTETVKVETLARIMREAGDWLMEWHQEKLF